MEKAIQACYNIQNGLRHGRHTVNERALGHQPAHKLGVRNIFCGHLVRDGLSDVINNTLSVAVYFAFTSNSL